jgi:glycosyltransferase involved in cell wall biosynthesis
MQFARVLVDQGYIVDVVCLRRDGQSHFEVVDDVNLFRIQVRIRNESNRLDYIYRIIRFFIHSAIIVTLKHLKRPYQLLDIFAVPDFLVFAAVFPKIMGARVILDFYDLLPEFYLSKFDAERPSLTFRFLLWLEKQAVAFSDHAIASNHIWKQRLEERSVLPEKCTAIPYCSDPRIFSPRHRTRVDNRFILIYPGTLNRHQGVDVAIRAFARVAPKIPESEFQVYGEGPEKEHLISLATELGVGDRVIFHAFIPASAIADAIANCDVLVVPKRAGSLFGNEAASTKILDSMTLGVPVIASWTKVESYYFDESMIRFFESENVSKLAECILQLRNDLQLRDELVRNARRFVERNTWKDMAQRFLALVDSLLMRDIGSGVKG